MLVPPLRIVTKACFILFLEEVHTSLVPLAIIDTNWYITKRIMYEIEPRYFEGW